MSTTPHPQPNHNALYLLQNDHERVRQIFSAFAKAKTKGSRDEMAALVEEACQELMVHAAVEEELFYPAALKAMGADELLGEAMVEHGEAKHLIGNLVTMDPNEPLYGATVQVLSEYVQHHVAEEQNKIFPRVNKAKVDLEALGEEILRRRQELLTEVASKGIGKLLTPTKHKGA